MAVPLGTIAQRLQCQTGSSLSSAISKLGQYRSNKSIDPFYLVSMPREVHNNGNGKNPVMASQS